MRFAGRLHTWNEERGFGFIRPDGGGQDVFVHISALPKPVPGPDETLTFAVALNAEGKKKAVDVRLQRVEQVGLAEDRARTSRASGPSRRPREDGAQRNWIATVLAFAILAGLLAYGYQGARRFVLSQRPATPQSAPTPLDAPASSSPFRCDGRTMCSQMTSCAEATWFLRNCPGTKMDGNHDGVPCEQQWCTGWAR